ncbi:unnamed protein product [Allacma fusca]|uniref:Uncharacterized protein n=1 Tax=Allacma fusca TaxID=39272 RepID=A0A8J2LF58_9HEXA|nr:unnamed protein product [Allacma fusca]
MCAASEKSLRGSQKAIKGKFTKIETDLNNQNNAKLSQVRHDALLSSLNNYWTQIETIHEHLFPFLADAATEDAQNQEYNVMYDRHRDLLEQLEMLKPSAAPNTTKVKVKLPDLEVPSFSGELENWNSFHDLFVAAVHNRSHLPDSQKLQYLKSSLKNGADSSST